MVISEYSSKVKLIDYNSNEVDQVGSKIKDLEEDIYQRIKERRERIKEMDETIFRRLRENTRKILEEGDKQKTNSSPTLHPSHLLHHPVVHQKKWENHE